ncbi:MAG: MTH1187 family thiamine-binding protein [Candidatus Competibacterales bacterium]
MSTLVNLAIFPIGRGESVSAYVARTVAIIRDSGLDYQMGPMGTAIEGEWAEVMAVVERCLQALAADCDRVYGIVTFDWRRGQGGRLTQKVQSVADKLA